MAQRGINKKIMAFIGSPEVADLVSELAEHTDNIYAAVSDDYGKSPHPGGNITLIAKYLNEEDMERWMDRGVELVIDGTDLIAQEARSVIRKLCEKKGIEYHRVVSKFNYTLSTTLIKQDDVMLRELEYTVGNVIVEGDEELFGKLTAVKDFSEKIIPLIPYDTELFNSLINMGYKLENIISFNRTIHSGMLTALFIEFKVSHYVFPGDYMLGMGERLTSVESSPVKALIYGELEQEEGYSAAALWKIFADRFGIED